MSGDLLAALDALDASGVDPVTAAGFRDMLTRPGFAYGQLDIEEQKRVTVEQADLVARWFIEDAGLGYEQDPMAAWIRFGGMPWANHNRCLPRFALQLVIAGALPEEDARDFLVVAWAQPEWPEANGGTDGWREAWERVGFASDNEDIAPPTETVTMWRGAVPARKRGMAWTTDLDRARWFARRFPKSKTFGQGRVYEADVDPDRVYARLIHRGEDEWVIDTRRLPIRTVEVPRGD